MFGIESLNKLQDWFASLPGIGPKSAARLVYHVVQMKPEDVRSFAEDMYKARLSVRKCKICKNLTDQEVCSICGDDKRDKSVICVVKDIRDVIALERMRDYKGVYHVLGGSISPMEGIGPDELSIKELVSRIDGSVKEVILATNPDVKGETTAMYIYRLLQDKGVAITRIAHGVPVGGELEYTDDVTLQKSLEGRRPF